MIRYYAKQHAWWLCSKYPKCNVYAIDDRYSPRYLAQTELKEIYFNDQLSYLLYTLIRGDKKKELLTKLVMRKGLKTLSPKILALYYRDIEPLRKSIFFTKCIKCRMAIDKNNAVDLKNSDYLCERCWSWT